MESKLWEPIMAVLSSLGLKYCPKYQFISFEFLPIVKIFQYGHGKVSPEEILRILKEAALLVAHKECEERSRLLGTQKLKFWDRVNRAWATLLSCQLLSAPEALYCLSSLKLGVYFGWFPKEFGLRLEHYTCYLLSGTFRVCMEGKDRSEELENANRARYIQRFITVENRPRLPDAI
jgi:protein-arginine kinase